MKPRSSQHQTPLDDETLLKLLLRSILYNAPWEKPEDERLSDGTYSVDDKLDVAKGMVPCIDIDSFHKIVETLRGEDPIVSLKVLFAEADGFRSMQMAPPDPFYDGANWRDSEQRLKRIREFYKLAKYRSAYPFKDDSQKKEESWRVWNTVQSGEAMRKPPPADDVMKDEDYCSTAASSPLGASSASPTLQQRVTSSSTSSEPTSSNIFDNAAAGSGGDDDDSTAQRGPSLNLGLDDTVDGQFIGGLRHSCFGGVFNMRVHALKWTGKADAKTARSLPGRATCSFVFCINTKPQWQETELVTFAPRQFITPPSVMDFDEGIDTGAQPLPQEELSLPPSGENNNNNNGATTPSTAAAAARGDQLPDIDEVSSPSKIPIRDCRPAFNLKKDDGGDDGGDANNNNNKKEKEKYTCYYDFRQEAAVLDFKSMPIRVDFCELNFTFRTPPTCCGIFGSDDICSVKIPLSALYVQILGLNSMNRKRHFKDPYGEEGVHSVHKWFDCTPSSAQGSGATQDGTFSVCLSMHLRCQAKSHNNPLFQWNPFTDPHFDIHKGQCKILTNVPAMHQMWREPLHRYFIHLIENFSSRLEDIEVAIVENFHDLYCLDPQFLFVWTLRSQLFAGKLYSSEDRATVRRAATCLGQLLINPAQLATISAEKFVHDTRKHAIARFLAIPGQLEELFADDERIIHANDALNLAVTVLHTFQIDDVEPSITAAAKRDVAAFFIVGPVTAEEVMQRFAEHCQEVLKDFSLCFQHMKKAVAWGLRIRKLEERMAKRAAGARQLTNGNSNNNNNNNNNNGRLTCSKVITLRMQAMADDVCKRLRTAINLVHVVGANSLTKARPEAISPLMQLMSSATECADSLAQYGLEPVAHELEGIVPQTFLPMFLSLARERLHGLVRSIVRAFPLEPSKPGRVHSTPAASDAFQFIRATFDEFCECARACDVETVLICLGSLLNYLIEAVDVFVNEMNEWNIELEKDNVTDTALEKADVAGMCLARFQKSKARFERDLTMHATLNSFYRLLVDFWEDDGTVDFIHNLEAAISHLDHHPDDNKNDDNNANNDKNSSSAMSMAAAAGADSEHQVFQAKTSMMEACNAKILPLEITMMDQIVPAALVLTHEYAVWAKDHPAKTEEELHDQQNDISGATINCLRQVLRAIVHRADRAVLRDRLGHVAVRSIVTNLINLLALSGQMMTAEGEMNLRLQRGLVSRVVQATREEMVALCEAAGEQVLKSNESILNELDTALAVSLMSSMQLVFTLTDLQQQKEAPGGGENNNNGNNGRGQNKPAGHKRELSAGQQQLQRKVSAAKYENLLKKACLARAHCGDTACIECATAMSLGDFVHIESPVTNSERKGKK